MNELELVVLKRDIPEHGLARGDVGTVVHVYADGAACVFRRKPATDSGPSRPPVPEQAGHPFRACRPAIPADAGHPC